MCRNQPSVSTSQTIDGPILAKWLRFYLVHNFPSFPSDRVAPNIPRPTAPRAADRAPLPIAASITRSYLNAHSADHWNDRRPVNNSVERSVQYDSHISHHATNVHSVWLKRRVEPLRSNGGMQNRVVGFCPPFETILVENSFGIFNRNSMCVELRNKICVQTRIPVRDRILELPKQKTNFRFLCSANCGKGSVL